MLAVETFLVRHGSYDRPAGELNEQGMQDAAQAAEDLQAAGLGAFALILSSDAPRTMGTAHIIADCLSLGPVVPSKRMNVGGNAGPTAIDDLDRWILTALDEAGVTLEGREGLVVVTHEPLIAAAQRSMDSDSRGDIGYGEVLRYTPGVWTSPYFSAASAALAEEQIAAANNPAGAQPGEGPGTWETLRFTS